MANPHVADEVLGNVEAVILSLDGDIKHAEERLAEAKDRKQRFVDSITRALPSVYGTTMADAQAAKPAIPGLVSRTHCFDGAADRPRYGGAAPGVPIP